MMDKKTIDRLNAEEYDEKMALLLSDCKKWMRHSRAKMKRSYKWWDRNLMVWKGDRVPDEPDFEAVSNDEPQKLVVPMTFQQVMTFTTFAFMLFKQNPTFFEFDTDGNEEYPLTEINEDFLERDLRKNQWDSLLFQLLLDASRFGFCAVKSMWVKDTQFVNVPQPPPTPITDPDSGLQVMPSELPPVPTEFTKYEGNRLTKISPFRSFPDMRLPLTRCREGRFFADEMEFHIHVLYDLESKGVLAGTKYIDRLTQKMYSEGMWDTDVSRYDVEGGFSKQTKQPGSDESKDDFMCINTEGHFRINPSKYDLGPEDHDCDFIINMVNDQRLTRVERMDYVHGELIYDVGMFLPDVHNKLGMSLPDQISGLQDVVTFLFNTRVVSIRQGLEKHLVVDPSKFEMPDVQGRSPIIRVKKGQSVAQGGLDAYMKQLSYTDGTQTHLQEAASISDMAEQTTGVNKNAMGQYAPGRRSANEISSANNGAASRMTIHASLLWSDMFAPLGMKMLTNLRQFVSPETFVKVVGKTSPVPGYVVLPEDALASAPPMIPGMPPPPLTPDLYSIFCPPLDELVGNEDFFIFNATSPSQRGYIAQALQDLTTEIMSNPELLQLTNYDPTKLIDAIFQYRGVRNTNRFKRAPAVGGPTGVPQPPGPPGAGQVPNLPIQQPAVQGLPNVAEPAAGASAVGNPGFAA